MELVFEFLFPIAYRKSFSRLDIYEHDHRFQLNSYCKEQSEQDFAIFVEEIHLRLHTYTIYFYHSKFVECDDNDVLQFRITTYFMNQIPIISKTFNRSRYLMRFI